MNPLDDRPPFWGSWRRIHAGLAVYLLLLIAMLSWFTRSWNR